MKIKIKHNCDFFGHRWTKWVQESVEMGRLIDGQVIRYTQKKQSRTCRVCGYMQEEQVNT